MGWLTGWDSIVDFFVSRSMTREIELGATDNNLLISLSSSSHLLLPDPLHPHNVSSGSRSRRERTHRSKSTRRYAQCYPHSFPEFTSAEYQLCVHSYLSHILYSLSFPATQPTPALSVASSSNSPTLTSPTLASEDHVMDSDEADFVGRLSTIPVVSTAIRAYEQSKASSRVVKVRLSFSPPICPH